MPKLQERLIQLLEAVAGSCQPASIADLIGLTGFPKASVYRNIASLIECGFVEETDEGNRYILGMRFTKIALTGKADTRVINAVSAMMQKIVKELSETAFLARYRGGRVDMIHIEIPSDPIASYIYPGMGVRPAHACSSAKAIAAFIHPELRDALFDIAPLQFTSRTLTDPVLMGRELKQVQRNGFAICDGEIDEGVTSIAVPINVDRLGAIFSIGIVGPSHRIQNIIQDRILPVLRTEAIRAAAAIQHCSVIEAETTNNTVFEMANTETPTIQ